MELPHGIEPWSAAYETAVLPIELEQHQCRPSGRPFLFSGGLIPRAPNFAKFHAKGRGGPGENAPGDPIPPWGRKDYPSAGLLHGEVRKPTTPQDFPSAKRKSRPARWASSRRSAKVGPGGRLCPSPGFGRAAGPGGGENASLPYSARKSQFLRNGDVPATESLFLFAVLWLAFLPGQSETGVAGGEKPAAPNPGRPRGGPPQRPRPAPGFRAASATARPGDSAPVRLLEKALWVPPTTEPFRPAPSGKPERERKRKGGSPMPRPPPVLHDRSA